MATVARAFNTHSRRWVAGEPISDADDLTPHTFDDLANRGFIEVPKPASPAPSPKKPKK